MLDSLLSKACYIDFSSKVAICKMFLFYRFHIDILSIWVCYVCYMLRCCNPRFSFLFSLWLFENIFQFIYFLLFRPEHLDLFIFFLLELNFNASVFKRLMWSSWFHPFCLFSWPHVRKDGRSGYRWCIIEVKFISRRTRSNIDPFNA